MNDKLADKRQAHINAAEKIAVRIALKEYAAKEKERKAARDAAARSRKADAHRKIKLGGLVIVSGIDEWDEAEIVGALLYAKGQSAEFRERFRNVGIAEMTRRADLRNA